MRFEATLKKQKIKRIDSVLTTMITIIRTKPIKHSIFMMYIANLNQIRILVQSEIAPMVLVLQSDLMDKVISTSSKNQTQNTSIGFQFQNGLSFLQKLLMEIKSQKSIKNVLNAQDKFINFRITKSQQLRFLQIRVVDKVSKELISKPSKNEQQLFSYQFIDGVSNSKVHFMMNMNNILQILKAVSKNKMSHMVQMAQNKKLIFTIILQNSQSGWAQLSFKTVTTRITASGSFSHISLISGDKNYANLHGGCYQYEIDIKDAEILLMILKHSQIILDLNNQIAVADADTGVYNCSISLKSWIIYLQHRQMIDQDVRLKTQHN